MRSNSRNIWDDFKYWEVFTRTVYSPTRRPTKQPTSVSQFVTDSSRSAMPAAISQQIQHGAVYVELDEDANSSSRATTHQSPSSLGFRARFDSLNLYSSNTGSSQPTRYSPRSLKRKVEHDEHEPRPPAKHSPIGGYRTSSRRKLEFGQDEDLDSTNRGPRSAIPLRRLPRTNIEESIFDSASDPDPDPDPDSALNSAYIRPTIITPDSNYAVMIELNDGSDDDDESYDELQVTGVQRAMKQKKLVIVPRVLDSDKKGIRLTRVTGLTLKPGVVVEFTDGTFMKIRKIYEDILVGSMFTRADTFGPEMPHQRDGVEWNPTKINNEPDTRIPLFYKGGKLVNEVVQKIRTVTGEHPADYGLWRRSIKDVVRVRSLRITNQPLNDINCLTSRHISAIHVETAQIKKDGTLQCRWKDVTMHDQYGKWQEQRLERPSDDETDSDWTDDDEKLRVAWRGYTPLLKYNTDPLFLCDAYCGAGGVSTGAKHAGLTIALSLDHDPKKIATFRANFPECQSFVIGAAEFITLAQKRGWRVDILHLSPPCQPFSQANARPNEEKNERNQAPLFACSHIINALRPRIVTVEEAPGIVSRHHPWFYALLEQFTDIGFSLRWSFIRCSDFGVPQLRRRFFIVAAAPGEDLPPFPTPTHAPGTVSIATALRDLERAHRASPLTKHDTSVTFETPKPPFDPHTLAKTITCGGGQGNYHPSGLRQYTPREFAALQTFPSRYRFGRTEEGKEFYATELREQIGNAVPPLVAKAVLGSVAKSLRESDMRRGAKAQAKARVEIQKDVIVLDDD